MLTIHFLPDLRVIPAWETSGLFILCAGYNKKLNAEKAKSIGIQTLIMNQSNIMN